MKIVDRIIGVIALVVICLFPAATVAHDPVQHAHAEWYNKQTINPQAIERMGIWYKSCCDNGDVFKTRFRVGSHNQDQWEYLKDGHWKVIPPDIIKDEDTRSPTRPVHQQARRPRAVLLRPAGGHLMKRCLNCNVQCRGDFCCDGCEHEYGVIADVD